MVQNNKVLTVSYGTFSCTLEGFDDSFETMKSIAEYFRDLAADDRYFGSEPPQPDAEMLTRIAQRDIARKVEARQNDTGLLLRATDQSPAEADAPRAGIPTPAPVAQPQPPADPQPAPAATADAPADSIAAKLQRIRSVVSHSDEAATQYGEDVDTGYIEPARAPVDAISAAFEAGALDPSDLVSDPVENADPVAEPVVEPLQLQEDDLAVAPDMAEPISVEEPEALIETHQEDTPREDIAALAAEFEEEVEPVDQEVEPEEVQVSIETAFEQDAGTLDEILELTGKQDLADFDAEPVEIQTPDETAIVPEEYASEEASSDEVTSEDITFEEDPAAKPDADVDMASISNLMSEDMAAPPAPTSAFDQDTVQDDAQNVLSADDEAELLEEISLVEAELAAREDEQETKESELNQDVLRLMESADARMDDPETSDQRETYSHLRTAVAATEAEREAETDTALEDAEYRGDLASVVSPRRPEVNVTSIRPRSEAAAPLKLVAEQRVDAASAETRPVTPRRVETPTDTGPEEGGFASFAQEQGAQSLSDLLEAAAAYLSFIEGQEKFSRPQLMNKVRSLKQDEFNREESLKSFGQLLRDGKIEKAGGGRFAASTGIGFRPDDTREAV